ncbi:hypothetical protein ACFXB3_11580 [Streptomyces sp. NPDC059447]|uniref:aspartate-alanine antiporter-like transporter n=1 Tax=Streptomyces sp. NPDC059447 TaxID=3346834 RepID=UPI0036936488
MGLRLPRRLRSRPLRRTAGRRAHPVGGDRRRLRRHLPAARTHPRAGPRRVPPGGRGLRRHLPPRHGPARDPPRDAAAPRGPPGPRRRQRGARRRPGDGRGRLLGALAGAQTTTAALGALAERARSQIPALGTTVPYALGNVLLTMWGSVIVLLRR